jgi:transcriptional regulator with XRE-family HTH domain
MPKTMINRQLGDFLRERRLRLTPQSLGLPGGGRRRTPGLRREEVAALAGISSDWYVRLEQGRHSPPSQATVDALARVMRLTAVDRAHLIKLAFRQGGQVFRRERVPKVVEAVIHRLSSPAYIIGARMDMLCWNQAAVATFRDYSKIPVGERNTLFQMFTNPALREFFPDWRQEARSMLENFRRTYDLWSHAPAFNELVDDLSARSPEFRRWWASHGVGLKASGEKIIHSRLRTIKLSYATFSVLENPDLKLIIYAQASA